MSRGNAEVECYNSSADFWDDRVFEVGEVYYIKDKLISMPNTDRLDTRNYHKGRPVVIMQNNSENSNPKSPLITIAPTSSNLKYKRENDLILTPEKDGVKKKCFLITKLMQPVLKVDLERSIGQLSNEKIKQSLSLVLEKLGVID